MKLRVTFLLLAYTSLLTSAHATDASRPNQTDAAGAYSYPTEYGFSESDEEIERHWRVGIHYFKGTVNTFGQALTGDWDTISPDGVRVALGYIVIDNLWDYPIEVIIEGGLMWHNEKGAQDDVWQSTFGLKLAWTEFPWNEHVRTRIAFTEGVSYVSHIPETEKRNRETDTSAHFLNYLEPSIAFNCGDLYRFIGRSSRTTNDLDRAWLMFSVPHRSGAWGTYGKDNDGEHIKGGSNYLAVGLEYEF